MKRTTMIRRILDFPTSECGSLGRAMKASAQSTPEGIRQFLHRRKRKN